MRFCPPRPATRRRPVLATVLAAVLATHALGPASGAAQAQVRLPALGESAGDDLNPSQERRIGDQIMREIRRDPDYLDDPLLQDYLQALWQPLVQVARTRGDIGADTGQLFPYEAFLVRDRSVNAFALPGGYVGVNLGLIAMTNAPDELASVLAHELSHVTQRHIARGVSAQSRTSAMSLAAMLLGLVVAARAQSPDMAQAAVMGSQAAMAQSQLSFSRDMEREADRQGFGLLTGAGYSGAGMMSMFDRMDQSNRLNDSGAYPYLRSHPLTVERISDARQRVEAAGESLTLPAPPLAHLLMQGRARVLMDPTVQAWRRLQDLDQRAQRSDLAPAERQAAWATSALASTQLRDFARAEASTRALEAAAASSPPPEAEGLRLRQQTLVQLALARGDAAAAARAMAALAGDGARASVLLRAQVALAQNQTEAWRSQAEALNTWVADHRQDANAWQLLSQLNERLGQPLRAVRAQAEVQSALGNWSGAIDRLRAGQQLARNNPGPNTGSTDFIELSVIDARLRELQAQQRAFADEQRANSRGSNRGPSPPEE